MTRSEDKTPLTIPSSHFGPADHDHPTNKCANKPASTSRLSISRFCDVKNRLTRLGVDLSDSTVARLAEVPEGAIPTVRFFVLRGCWIPSGAFCHASKGETAPDK